MDQKVKFATLMAKLGVHFGAADGNYDDKERAFVNLFIGLLKTQGELDMDVENVIRDTTNKRYTLDELVAECNEILNGVDAEEHSKTIENMCKFIETIIEIDGRSTSEERKEFALWKKAIGA